MNVPMVSCRVSLPLLLERFHRRDFDTRSRVAQLVAWSKIAREMSVIFWRALDRNELESRLRLYADVSSVLRNGTRVNHCKVPATVRTHAWKKYRTTLPVRRSLSWRLGQLKLFIKWRRSRVNRERGVRGRADGEARSD